MDMSPSMMISCPSASTKLIVVLCLFWPFVAAWFLASRMKSAGPIAAAIVPLALCTLDVFWQLHRALRGLAISGAAPIAASASIAESLTFLAFGAFFAIVTLIVAAIRRHRLFVDRLTAVVFAVLIIETIGALFIAATIASGSWQFYACLTGAGVAAIAALVAAFWTFRTGRGRKISTPIPYGITIFVIATLILGVFLRQEVLRYMQIAMGRQ